MKILICLICCAVLLPAVVFADDLEDALESSELSNGVIGEYSVNSSSDRYLISAGHTKGTKAYATGNFTTSLYYNDCSEGTDKLFVSGDLLTGSAFTSADFNAKFVVVGVKDTAD